MAQTKLGRRFGWHDTLKLAETGPAAGFCKLNQMDAKTGKGFAQIDSSS